MDMYEMKFHFFDIFLAFAFLASSKAFDISSRQNSASSTSVTRSIPSARYGAVDVAALIFAIAFKGASPGMKETFKRAKKRKASDEVEPSSKRAKEVKEQEEKYARKAPKGSKDAWKTD
ncbi:hypothetical protein INT45_001090 [Circinella minor]|uniref:Uncharacterized protein n=1 Tax=Circinella minor TaxID=1195481 RepID=A0A8H7SDZ2_9FUNG|nr:hypothetical protein INT45_001090 [Circinella minor]